MSVVPRAPKNTLTHVICVVLVLKETCGRWEGERGNCVQCCPTCHPLLRWLEGYVWVWLCDSSHVSSRDSEKIIVCQKVSRMNPNGPKDRTFQPSPEAPLTVRVISTADSDSLCCITEGPSCLCSHPQAGALIFEHDSHVDLWHFISGCCAQRVFPHALSDRNGCLWYCKSKSDKAALQLSVRLCLKRGAVIYCPADPPGNTSPLHWQEPHRPTPPVAQTRGAPYKEAKYFPPDKCVYPSITAYHKLAASGPCMGCIHTSAKLQRGSVVVRSTSQDLWHLSHNCRVTHLMCLEVNARCIYSPNVLVITFTLFKADFHLFYDAVMQLV